MPPILEKTVEFLKKVRPNHIFFNVFHPLPGTTIYRKLVSRKQKIPEWNRIGGSEAAGINYADMDRAKFERLYSKTKLTLMLPNNLYYFIRDNIHHPIGLLRAFFTQFKGVFSKTLRAIRRLLMR